MMRTFSLTCAAFAIGAGALSLQAAALEVGPGKRFTRPCAAFAAAANGDDILIDAGGSYSGDVCNITRSNLYIRGINGRPAIDGKGTSAGGKGIWTIQGNDIIVDNIEFLNAASPDRNGAGIRHEGRNIRIRRCYFHDNQDGILATSNAESETIIEFSEFDNNGSPDGQAHNVYVASGAKLIFRFNYSHRARTGHLLKTRLKENYILYNRLLQEDGNGSYECDLPDQGKVWLVGNVLQQGRTSENQHMISFGTESRTKYPESHLYAFHNTFVNESSGSDVPVEQFLAAPGDQQFPILFSHNIFYGRGTFSDSPSPVLLQNLIITERDPNLFVNPAVLDYRLLAGSQAIDAASAEYPAEPGDIIKAAYESLAPACGKPRLDDGHPDFGAFEWDPQQSASLGLVNTVCNATNVPAPGIRMLMNSASALVGGVGGSGRVILEQAAPENGFSVNLSSSAPQDLIVPQSVAIPEGGVSGAFTFTTKAAAVPAQVRITASADGGLETTVDVSVSPIGVDSIRMEPASTGGGSTTGLGRLTLNAAAPPGGVVVRLVSSNPAVAQVPEQATVGQGATQGTFSVRTFPVNESTPVIITAMSPAGERSAVLTVLPAGILSLVPTPARFGGGAPLSLRVNFNAATPASNTSNLEFESSHPNIIPAPAPVAVSGGITFTTVSLRTNGVATSTQVTLTVSFNGSQKPVVVTVDPPDLASVTSNLVTFGSGGTIRMTVSLNAPSTAPAPIPVQLMADTPGLLKLPDTVSISPGATAVSFDVGTAPVTARTRVIVIASIDGLGKTVALTLDPLAVTAMACPASAKGGTTITCRPTINGPAPLAGTQITLATSAPTIIGIPATVTVPANQTTASFLVETRPVPLSSMFSIGGTFGGVTRTANITLTP